jgi:hypothetical protein
MKSSFKLLLIPVLALSFGCDKAIQKTSTTSTTVSTEKSESSEQSVTETIAIEVNQTETDSAPSREYNRSLSEIEKINSSYKGFKIVLSDRLLRDDARGTRNYAIQSLSEKFFQGQLGFRTRELILEKGIDRLEVTDMNGTAVYNRDGLYIIKLNVFSNRVLKDDAIIKLIEGSREKDSNIVERLLQVKSNTQQVANRLKKSFGIQVKGNGLLRQLDDQEKILEKMNDLLEDNQFMDLLESKKQVTTIHASDKCELRDIILELPVRKRHSRVIDCLEDLE